MAKFLLVTHIYPPAVDGGSKVIYKLGQYFHNHGHQIMVLTSDASSTDDFTHPYKKVNNTGLPVYTIFHRPLKLLSKVLSKGPIFKFFPFVKFLISCLKFHPDYIIAGPLPTTSILYANFIKLITPNCKLIINASFHPTDSEFSQPILVNTLKSADFIWTLTDFETNYFHDNLHIPHSKMINVGNGIDQSFLKPSLSKEDARRAGGLNLLFIGSFSAHKGLLTLIDAFSLLKNNCSLTLAGQPTLYSPTIEYKINSLPHKIKSKIKIIYSFKSGDLAHLLDQSTILISPSTQESFGLVLIEAMARKVPVIAANIPASAELINKSGGGLLFTPNDPQDLATKINFILKNKNNFGPNGFNYVKTHCTWDKIGDTLWQKISSS